MMAPQVVGVLLKTPGQRDDSSHAHPRIPPLDPQETKIRGELYVEDLGEQRMITIRMGWLWVEGTQMKLPLRALNLRQAVPSLCQPHVSALGFTLSNSQNKTLATFWADTEPIYWSWVRAIAAELVRQTPFRAQRSLNFLEILTICPRGPVPLPDSPTETRRRSRSELRPCFRGSYNEKRATGLSLTLEESRRRTRSELRGWSSNSSDEDVVSGEFRNIPELITRTESAPRPWAFSESSEGSDDSLPWSGGQSSVDSVDSVTGPPVIIPEPETREQRIQRYKETRRRENEARSRRVVEEDARRRKARAEENNNSILPLINFSKLCQKSSIILQNVKNNIHTSSASKNRANDNNNSVSETTRNETDTKNGNCKIESTIESVVSSRLSNDVEAVESVREPSNERASRVNRGIESIVATEESKSSVNTNTNVVRNDSSERRSRARERRAVREKAPTLSLSLPLSTSVTVARDQIDGLKERKERLSSLYSRIPIPHEIAATAAAVPSRATSARATRATITPISGTPGVRSSRDERTCATTPKSPVASSPRAEEPSQEAVARLLERCQRVDHYVPVRDKLTLFESLSRLGGRLARSTEDLGRAKTNPSPRGKQRARSLHDLNRAARSVPVREMCRFFEGERSTAEPDSTRKRLSDTSTHPRTRSEGCTPPVTTRIKMPTSAVALKSACRKRSQQELRH